MKLAILGGSLFSQINGLDNISEEIIETPFGNPSSHLFCGEIDGREIVYLNRHGMTHDLEPHRINYRANMFALKLLEVTDIIGVAAVGGITENMSPLKCVVPDQLIDYTYGRKHTINDGYEDTVTHIDFSYPYDDIIRGKLVDAAITNCVDCEAEATYGVTQGPRLETIAEIGRMKRDGCDIVGMTGMPEAAIARELEMRYASLSLVVNWAAGADPADSGRKKHEIISMDEIRQRVTDGNKIVEKILSSTISTMEY